MKPAIPVMRTFTTVLCAVRRFVATGVSARQRSNQSWTAPYTGLSLPVGVGDRELGGHVAQVVVGEQDVGLLRD